MIAGKFKGVKSPDVNPPGERAMRSKSGKMQNEEEHKGETSGLSRSFNDVLES